MRRVAISDVDGLSRTPQATRNGRAAGPKSGTERNKERRPLGSELSEVWKYRFKGGRFSSLRSGVFVGTMGAQRRVSS
jgi:hypothetical protein